MRHVPVIAICLAVAACASGPANQQKTESRSARVALAPTQGNDVRGELALSQQADGVRVHGVLSGLKAEGDHGFHVHEKGDCGSADASSAGAHFNPAGTPHGNPAAGVHHAGDMANLHADGAGKATVDLVLPGVSLGGANDIVGRALIVHADPDDYVSQPAGNSGARVACGVIVGGG
jgi:superoxide dismutase, Cu-Zn family